MTRDEEQAQPPTETEPLLAQHQTDGGEGGDSRHLLIAFEADDQDDPRQWPYRKKMLNVFVISMMAVLSPLASSMFTPGIGQIADDLHTDTTTVIGCTTGFVVMLGIGPLLLAPLSEEFGRRPLYLVCFSIFTLLQIPSALAPNIATLIAMRTLSGFFGSVSIANGGGTLSDLMDKSQRSGVFGYYLLGVLLGPTLGPLLGGVIVEKLGWRWVFWFLAIICSANTLAGFIFLRETYAPAILQQRKQQVERDEGVTNKYHLESEDRRPLWKKLAFSLKRPLSILIQPIVLTMSTYQAIIFSTTYSIYTNMQPIYQGGYGFSTTQVGSAYLAPGLGFLFAVWFLVPRIDTVYNALTRRNDGKACPEFRLPLANIGAVLIPIALFWFAWTVESHTYWAVSLASTFFYGIGQVMILNCTTNYYIDAFERHAASAIAAGATFRSVVGGVVPLFAPLWFEKLGYGYGISVFALLGCLMAPAPLLFYRYGATIRERFHVNL